MTGRLSTMRAVREQNRRGSQPLLLLRALQKDSKKSILHMSGAEGSGCRVPAARAQNSDLGAIGDRSRLV